MFRKQNLYYASANTGYDLVQVACIRRSRNTGLSLLIQVFRKQNLYYASANTGYDLVQVACIRRSRNTGLSFLK